MQLIWILCYKNCSKLFSIDLSNFDTSLVKNMCSMFKNCNNLKIIDISSFNLGKIEDVSSMFENVSNLKYINLFNVQKKKKFGLL